MSKSVARMAAKGGSRKGDVDPVAGINVIQTEDSGAYVPLGPLKYKADFDMDVHVDAAWEHWRSIGDPRIPHHVAPLRPALTPRNRKPSIHHGADGRSERAGISHDGQEVRLRLVLYADAALENVFRQLEIQVSPARLPLFAASSLP